MTITAVADSQVLAPDQDAQAPAVPGPGLEVLVTEELLVEEVSIDGMCGVY